MGFGFPAERVRHITAKVNCSEFYERWVDDVFNCILYRTSASGRLGPNWRFAVARGLTARNPHWIWSFGPIGIQFYTVLGELVWSGSHVAFRMSKTRMRVIHVKWSRYTIMTRLWHQTRTFQLRSDLVLYCPFICGRSVDGLEYVSGGSLIPGLSFLPPRWYGSKKADWEATTKICLKCIAP